MGNYTKLIAAIKAVIKKNGRQEITGQLLQDALVGMTREIGKNWQYYGIATPETNPGEIEQNVFFLFSKPGTYQHFGNVVIEKKCLGLFKSVGSKWIMSIVIDEVGDILLPATPSRMGGVKIGKGFKVTADGTISEDTQGSDFATDQEMNEKFNELIKSFDVKLEDKADKTNVETELAKKQNKLTAGRGMEIVGDVISCILDTTIFKVVESLPSEPAPGNKGKIFVVADPDKPGSYIEYIWVKDKWEEFGKFDPGVDLTPYVKKIDMKTYFLDKPGMEKEKGMSQDAITKEFGKTNKEVKSNTDKIADVEKNQQEQGEKLTELEAETTYCNLNSRRGYYDASGKPLSDEYTVSIDIENINQNTNYLILNSEGFGKTIYYFNSDSIFIGRKGWFSDVVQFQTPAECAKATISFRKDEPNIPFSTEELDALQIKVKNIEDVFKNGIRIDELEKLFTNKAESLLVNRVDSDSLRANLNTDTNDAYLNLGGDSVLITLGKNYYLRDLFPNGEYKKIEIFGKDDPIGRSVDRLLIINPITKKIGFENLDYVRSDYDFILGYIFARKISDTQTYIGNGSWFFKFEVLVNGKPEANSRVDKDYNIHLLVAGSKPNFDTQRGVFNIGSDTFLIIDKTFFELKRYSTIGDISYIGEGHSSSLQKVVFDKEKKVLISKDYSAKVNGNEIVLFAFKKVWSIPHEWNTPANVTLDCDYTINGELPYIENKISISESDKRIGLNGNPCPLNKKFIYHAEMDAVTDEGYVPIIPPQSIHEPLIAKRLGFDFIEINVHKTKDGQYVVTHGNTHYLGKEVTTIDGKLPQSIDYSQKTLAEIQRDYRFRSQHEKYRTPIPSLEEYLQECHNVGLSAYIQYVDKKQIPIIDNIMGNNYILSLGERYDGAFVRPYDDKESLLKACDGYGKSFYPMMTNKLYDSLSDIQRKELIEQIHAKCNFVGYPGNYDSDNDVTKAILLGMDFILADNQVNDFDYGNIKNITDNINYSGLSVGGSNSGGVITLTDGQVISCTTDKKPFLSKTSLHINFKGEIEISMQRVKGKKNTKCRISSTNRADTYWLSSHDFESSPNLTIKAIGDVIVYDLIYRASEC